MPRAPIDLERLLEAEALADEDAEALDEAERSAVDFEDRKVKGERVMRASKDRRLALKQSSPENALDRQGDQERTDEGEVLAVAIAIVAVLAKNGCPPIPVPAGQPVQVEEKKIEAKPEAKKPARLTQAIDVGPRVELAEVQYVELDPTLPSTTASARSLQRSTCRRQPPSLS